MRQDVSDLLNPFELMALSAARKASAAILEIYHSGNFQAEQKADESPLTIADKTAHGIISKILAESGFPILSEEGIETDYDERKNWETFWLVDPLDGTKEFLKQNGEFTVNIALLRKDIPVFGVIAIPVERTVYFGPAKDGGVYCLEEETEVLKTVTATEVSGSDMAAPAVHPASDLAVRVVASRSHRDPKTEDFISGLKNPIIVSRGSSLKFLLLAERKADVYPRFAPTMEWDTAAADAILRPLNIRIRRIDDGKYLDYNKKNLRNPFFICRPD
ncbi:MAG: 3'(2'),5'-bisphosphate nucleotidase CysQ [Cyclobacteriaceae bacterium]